MKTLYNVIRLKKKRTVVYYDRKDRDCISDDERKGKLFEILTRVSTNRINQSLYSSKCQF